MTHTNPNWPTIESLMERYKIACDLKQVVDRNAIRESILRWFGGVSKIAVTVEFIEYKKQLIETAWDAWDARDARAARDLSWISTIVIGALETKDANLYRAWLPLLEAFEAGAFAMLITDHTIYVAERPSVTRVDATRRLHCENGPASKPTSGLTQFVGA